MSADWVRDAVFYQIFPERFANGDPSNDPPGTVPWETSPTRDNFSGGDLDGVRGKLGYLEELGVNALYLTPIFTAGTNHRYDAHDYLTIDPALGGDQALRRLLDDAHARGMRVVLDGVFNHCGDGHWAFRDLVEKGERSRYRDWFIVDRFPVEQYPPSYQTCGGAHYLPKLNTDNREVRDHLLEVTRHWLEVGIDGWRLDVPWKVPFGFWQEFNRVAKDVRADAYLVGEIWNSWGRWLEVFDGLMNYRLRSALLAFTIQRAFDAEDLVHETLAYLDDVPGGGQMLNLLGSHDTARLLTIAGGDVERAILAFAALFTYPGTPMLYYGDELGLEGEDDPDCRRTIPWWDPTPRPALAGAVRRLVAARRTYTALRRGSWEPLLARNRLLAYRRAFEGSEVIVVLNGGELHLDVRVPAGGGDRCFIDVLTGRRYEVAGGQLALAQVQRHAALVLVPHERT